MLFRPIPRARSAIPNFSYPHNKPRHTPQAQQSRHNHPHAPTNTLTQMRAHTWTTNPPVLQAFHPNASQTPSTYPLPHALSLTPTHTPPAPRAHLHTPTSETQESCAHPHDLINYTPKPTHSPHAPSPTCPTQRFTRTYGSHTRLSLRHPFYVRICKPAT